MHPALTQDNCYEVPVDHEVVKTHPFANLTGIIVTPGVSNYKIDRAFIDD